MIVGVDSTDELRSEDFIPFPRFGWPLGMVGKGVSSFLQVLFSLVKDRGYARNAVMLGSRFL